MYRMIDGSFDCIIVEDNGKRYKVPKNFKGCVINDTCFHNLEGDTVWLCFRTVERGRIWYKSELIYSNEWNVVLDDVDISPYLIDNTPPMPTPEELQHCDITVLGRVTNVLYDRKYMGSATCSPTDTFDLNTGVAWAYSRAIEKKKAEEKKEAKDIKVGDFVKVLNAGANFSTDFNWVKDHITNTELVAKFAYNDMLMGSPDKHDKFKVLYIDSSDDKAYIQNTRNRSCRVIGMHSYECNSLKKIVEKKEDEEDEDDDWF